MTPKCSQNDPQITLKLFSLRDSRRGRLEVQRLRGMEGQGHRGGSRGLRVVPVRARRGTWCPKGGLGGAHEDPRCAQRDPRGAKRGSNGTQRDPKGARGAPRRSSGDPERLKVPPGGPQRGQKGSKREPRGWPRFDVFLILAGEFM